MREIEYRGKEAQNGEWVYGFFYLDTYNNPKIISGDKTCYLIPETVGQYIGLKDSAGKKIFEGDIVRFQKILYVIKHTKVTASFDLYKNGDGLRLSAMCSADTKIIGNIHDNPELLSRE